jgi:hypothetical protein
MVPKSAQTELCLGVVMWKKVNIAFCCCVLSQSWGGQTGQCVWYGTGPFDEADMDAQRLDDRRPGSISSDEESLYSSLSSNQSGDSSAPDLESLGRVMRDFSDAETSSHVSLTSSVSSHSFDIELFFGPDEKVVKPAEPHVPVTDMPEEEQGQTFTLDHHDGQAQLFKKRSSSFSESSTDSGVGGTLSIRLDRDDIGDVLSDAAVRLRRLLDAIADQRESAQLILSGLKKQAESNDGLAERTVFLLESLAGQEKDILSLEKMFKAAFQISPSVDAMPTLPGEAL